MAKITDPDQISARTKLFEEQIYMFSEEASLMCSVEKDGSYWVVNGGWGGRRDGDTFTMDGDSVGRTIKDWKEIKLGNLTKEERISWYLPEEVDLNDYSDFDDDIPF